MLVLPGNAALMVIDVQAGMDDADMGPRSTPEAEQRIAELLAAWRAAGRPVIVVQHDSTAATGHFRPGTPGHALKPEVLPLAGEWHYRKTENSAFIGTTLEADLRAVGIGTLVMVGMVTEHCVSTTVRMAGNLGFTGYVVADATASFDQVGYDGRVRAAEDVHYGALCDLHGEFATVVTAADVLAALAAR
jgi:nicotinamidase-related amidase